MSYDWKSQQYDSDNFNTEAWKGLSEEDRQHALQGWENHLADEQGRDARELSFGLEQGADQNGNMTDDGTYFNPEDSGKLHIDESLTKDGSNQFDAMDGVAHEGRHATQYDECTKDNGTEQYSSDQSDRVKSSERYREYDANAYANSQLNSNEMKETFQNDPNYQQYQSEEGRGAKTEHNMKEDKLLDRDKYAEESDKFPDEVDKEYNDKFSCGVDPSTSEGKTVSPAGDTVSTESGGQGSFLGNEVGAGTPSADYGIDYSSGMTP